MSCTNLVDMCRFAHFNFTDFKIMMRDQTVNDALESIFDWNYSSVANLIVNELFYCFFLAWCLSGSYVFSTLPFDYLQNHMRSPIFEIFSQMRNQIGPDVDFELPDWLIKPKPINYTFIKRSIHQIKFQIVVGLNFCFNLI